MKNEWFKMFYWFQLLDLDGEQENGQRTIQSKDWVGNYSHISELPFFPFDCRIVHSPSLTGCLFNQIIFLALDGYQKAESLSLTTQRASWQNGMLIVAWPSPVDCWIESVIEMSETAFNPPQQIIEQNILWVWGRKWIYSKLSIVEDNSIIIVVSNGLAVWGKAVVLV